MEPTPPLAQLQEQFTALVEPHLEPAEAAQVWEALAPALDQVLTQLLTQATQPLNQELAPHGLRVAPHPTAAGFSWSLHPAILEPRSNTDVPSQAISSPEPTRLVGWL